MSADVTPIRPPEPPSRDRSLESVFDGMQDGLNALLCIHAALDDPRIDECEGFSAARSLLHRTFRELATTLEELEAWHNQAGRAERAGERP